MQRFLAFLRDRGLDSAGDISSTAVLHSATAVAMYTLYIWCTACGVRAMRARKFIQACGTCNSSCLHGMDTMTHKRSATKQ